MTYTIIEKRCEGCHAPTVDEEGGVVWCSGCGYTEAELPELSPVAVVAGIRVGEQRVIMWRPPGPSRTVKGVYVNGRFHHKDRAVARGYQ